eukprot:gene7346-14994_t
MVLFLILGISFLNFSYSYQLMRNPPRNAVKVNRAFPIMDLDPERLTSSWTNLLLASNMDIFNPAVLLELALTPGLLYYFLKNKNGEIEDLRSKYNKLEESFSSITNTSDSMKSDMAKYENVLSAVEKSLQAVGSKVSDIQTELPTMEKGVMPRDDIIMSINQDIESLKSGLNEITTKFEKTASGLEQKMASNLQASTKQLESAQVLNTRERAAMRRDMKNEQDKISNAALSRSDKLQRTLSLMGDEVRAIAEISRQAAVAAEAVSSQTQSRLMASTPSTSESTIVSAAFSGQVDVQSGASPTYPDMLDVLSEINDRISDRIRPMEARLVTLNDMLEALGRDKSNNNSGNNNGIELLEVKMQEMDAIRGAVEDLRNTVTAIGYTVNSVKKEAEGWKGVTNDVGAVQSEIADLQTLKTSFSSLQKNTLQTADVIRDFEMKMEAALEAAVTQADTTTTVKIAEVRQSTGKIAEDLSALRASTNEKNTEFRQKLDVLEDRLSSNVTALMSSIESTNMDMDDSLESLSEKQKRMSDEIRRAVESATAANQAQLTGVKGSLEDVRQSVSTSYDNTMNELKSVQSSLLDDLAKTEREAAAKVSDVEATVREEIRSVRAALSDSMESRTKEVKGDLTSFVEKKVNDLAAEVGGALQKTEDVVADKLAVVNEEVGQTRTEAAATAKSLRAEIVVAATENKERVSKAEQEIRRVAASSTSNIDYVKNSVERRLTGIQKEVQDTSQSLEARIERLDGSVEGRVEEVIDRNRVSTRIRNATGRLASTAATGLKRAGSAIKGGAKGAFFRIRRLASDGLRRSSNVLARLTSLDGDDDEDDDDYPPRSTPGSSSKVVRNTKTKRSGPSADDIVSEITFSDDLPTALQ